MQRRSQRGMSYTGFLFIAMIVAGVLKIVATVGPDYYDNYTINRMVKSVMDEGRTGSVDEFKRTLYDRFQINGIRDRSPDSFEYQMSGRNLIVTIDYEVRKPFAGNLDVVMHFNKSYTSEFKAEN